MKLASDYSTVQTNEPPKNEAGGYELPDFPAIRKADLITLPKSVEGTNCSNCMYISEDEGSHRHCGHPKLDQTPVNQRMCCAYWSHPDVKRPWKEQD